MRNRLYLQIYLAFVAVGVLCLFVAGATAALLWERGPAPVEWEAAAEYLLQTLPDPDDAEFEREFARVAALTSHSMTLWDADGARIVSAGDAIPPGRVGWFHTPELTGVRMELSDGRVLAAGNPHGTRRRWKLLAWLGAIAGAVALGCLPIARRITRRLEHLQGGVQRWGRGELDARVSVEGTDEVAQVAATFNDAADRVQALFDAQRRVLASASHELRSPLARVRMALELLHDLEPEHHALIEGAVGDIEELDATVGDLLRVGRMQALAGPADPEPVDLRALLEAEGRHVDAVVRGDALVVSGDARLLQRMIRNLLENARRHGAPPIEAWTTPTGLVVADRGPGVPAAEAERIFEPFHRPDGHAEGVDGGVGLGLHLVREIARHHGGTVRYRPRDGGGSEFEVMLASQG